MFRSPGFCPLCPLRSAKVAMSPLCPLYVPFGCEHIVGAAPGLADLLENPLAPQVFEIARCCFPNGSRELLVAGVVDSAGGLDYLKKQSAGSVKLLTAGKCVEAGLCRGTHTEYTATIQAGPGSTQPRRTGHW